ncbi:beta-1,6-N-acetylglucosaminyltransferase [uncultured Aquimarina sp.]|uniref:beta-1,6-N-acetylglucosaminyltransferase n=1 Tax=uncultured Aquimarina sp. TaxID=575652 RepID=UPI0026020C0A|nr:beta-1,6-N-acetylglucosaminyltransferase [uncultured Aquimarina sp.]
MENKIAILILAHHQPKQLGLLVNHLQTDFDVFVQIDKRSEMKIADLPKHENVFYFKEVEVYWGHVSQVENMKFILEKAYENRYSYYMYISGDDLPIKTNNQIKEFILTNKDNSYMYVNPLPIKTWGFNQGFDRLDRFWFMKISSRKIVKIVARITLILQRMFFIKVKRFPINYYAGSNWINLNLNAVEEVFAFLNDYPEFLKKLKYSRATDEMWVQSILMNSKEKQNIVHYDLRYIDWTTGPTFPRVLNEEDKAKIEKSDALFARKFNYSSHPKFIEGWLNDLKN